MRRLLPPGPANPATIQIQDRVYTCALGSFLDVNEADSQVMLANGWISAATIGGEGPTSARPPNPATGTQFFDTSLSLAIAFDGALWVNLDSGAAV